MPIFLKYLITAGIVVLVSEIAKRSDKLGALIASLPVVTTLVMIWMFAVDISVVTFDRLIEAEEQYLLILMEI